MAIEYNFKYMPLVGKLSGESMVRQTETAINEIAQIVNENTAQAVIINTLAETANANSVEALEKANEALETSGRIYITEDSAVNLDSYCESQMVYINNVASQNLPVTHKGFLEVKTNDDKTQATQVFVDDVNKKLYIRTGAIIAETVGDVTTYTASYGAWVGVPNITDLDNYLALTGGVMSGDIEFSASEWKIKGNDIDNDGELSIVGATDELNGANLNLYGRNHTEDGSFELNANNGTNTKTLKGTASGSLQWDGNEISTKNYVDNKANSYLPLSGGAITGNLSVGGTITGNLTGTASGNLPLSGGTMTGNITLDGNRTILNVGNSSNTEIRGGTSTTDGGSLLLYGINSPSTNVYKGGFLLRSTDGINVINLSGENNGTLKWDGKEIERVNTVNANYIRFESGLQIYWGTETGVTSSGKTVTFTAPFISAPKITLGTTASTACYYTGGTSTGVVLRTATSSGGTTVIYVAVGYWK